jgi:hypothetical protein
MGDKWVKRDSQFATGDCGRDAANIAAQDAQAEKAAKAEADRQAKLARAATARRGCTAHQEVRIDGQA